MNFSFLGRLQFPKKGKPESGRRYEQFDSRASVPLSSRDSCSSSSAPLISFREQQGFQLSALPFSVAILQLLVLGTAALSLDFSSSRAQLAAAAHKVAAAMAQGVNRRDRKEPQQPAIGRRGGKVPPAGADSFR